MRLAPSDGALGAAARWRLAATHTPRGGVAGDQLGRGTGSSMEFHDRRRYEPGDDVRHIDWRAMARTDEVFVRVHREEVALRLDLFVDVSGSMATSEEKAQALVDFAAIFTLAGQAGGFDVRILALGERAERITVDRLLGEGLELTSRRPLPDVLPEAVLQGRPMALRMLVSDFLVPMDPSAMCRQLSSGAGRIALLQVLSKDDREPEPAGALQLIDAETGEERNIVVDRAAVARYTERLGRLNAGLAEESRRLGGIYSELRPEAERSDELAELGRLGILE